jgi:hypothetical protein
MHDLRIWLKNIRALIRRPSQSPSTCGLDPSPKTESKRQRVRADT